MLSPGGKVNVMADSSCLGGLAVMMLAQNARDQSLIPRAGTQFFSPSKPTVTLDMHTHEVRIPFACYRIFCEIAGIGKVFPNKPVIVK